MSLYIVITYVRLKMKTLLILIVLVAAAGFGGKLYLEHKYESELDKAISFATYSGAISNIRYDKVEIGFDSSISVKGLRVTPAGYDDTITIDTLTFSSSDPMMPLKGGDIFKNGEFPEEFETKIKRINFDLRSFDKLNKTPECRSLTGAMKYSNAGYDRYDGDMRFKMDFRDVYNSKVYVDIFDQVSTTEIELTMDASKVARAVTRQDSLPINELLLATELNQDAAANIVDYCAGSFEVTSDAYIDKVVSSKKFTENTFGVDLGPDFRQALAKYMRGGSRIVVDSKPSDKLKNLSQAKFFKPNDVLGWLNMTVSLEGEEIPVEIPEITAAEQAVIDEKKKGPVVKKREYVAVSAARARDYVGRKVRIKRKGDKPTVKGRMSGFQNNRIAVEIYRHAGEMTLNIKLSDVSTLEVLQ